MMCSVTAVGFLTSVYSLNLVERCCLVFPIYWALQSVQCIPYTMKDLNLKPYNLEYSTENNFQLDLEGMQTLIG